MYTLPFSSVYFSIEPLLTIVSNRIYVFTFKGFHSFSFYTIFQRYLFVKFSSKNIHTLSYGLTHFFKDFSINTNTAIALLLQSVLLHEAWKNLSMIWFSCTETAVMLTSIVSVFSYTSSYFHQSLSFPLDNVNRLDSA